MAINYGRHTIGAGSRKGMLGITLMELMIVVIVVGILAAIALPNYRDYSARARRTEAKAALVRIANNQERFYLSNNTYTTDMSRLGFAAPGCNPSMEGTYKVCVTAANANTFSATATYQNDDAEAAKCLTFSIDGSGVKTSAPYTDCWDRRR